MIEKSLVASRHGSYEAESLSSMHVFVISQDIGINIRMINVKAPFPPCCQRMYRRRTLVQPWSSMDRGGSREREWKLNLSWPKVP